MSGDGSGLHLVGSLLRGKYGQLDGGEDRLVVSENMVGVVDGVSDASGARIDGKSRGSLTAEIVSGVLETVDPNLPLAAVVERMTDAVAEAFRHTEVLPGAVFAAVNGHRREVWRVGDPNVRINGVNFIGQTAPDRTMNAARDLVKKLSEADQAGGPQTFGALATSLVSRSITSAQHHVANQPRGYAVINGTPVPPEFHEVWTLNQAEHAIALSTDGYLRIDDSLEATEQRLRSDLDRPPDDHDVIAGLGLTAVQGGESYDDRAYITCVLRGSLPALDSA
ncbi:MAG: hypothetical protein AAGD35_07625 [Actinomycetota bacterium]